MRVLIDPDVELYPEVSMLFGAEEIRFPSVQPGAEGTAGVEVPDEVALRWRSARDAWQQAQREARAFLGLEEDE